MRSRYSAYVLGNLDYVFRTWHPRTRPSDLSSSAQVPWTGLEIHRASDDGDTGIVEFTAHHAGGSMHETSRFERRRGQWVYVDGDVT
jgi:SEC-C motif domain protein